MPIIKSAKKRVKVATKATIRNSKTKRSLKTAVKAFGKALTAKNKTDAVKALDKVQSELDKAAKKGILHKNKAARKKAQATRNAKAAGVPSGVKSAKVKTAQAAPVKKAAPAKKPVAKKAAAAKKAPAKKK